MKLPSILASIARRPARRRLATSAAFALSLFVAGCGEKKADATVSGTPPVAVLCAASLRPPVEEAAREFQAAGEGTVVLQFGGSQSLLSTLALTHRGDVFLPADRSYLDPARAKGLVTDEIPLAAMTAVLAVAKGNPKGISTLADLEKGGVRLVLANPELAAIGKLTAAALPPDVWKRLLGRAVAVKPNVSDAAGDVALGAADVAIVWDVVAAQNGSLQSVPLPELAPVTADVVGAVARHSQQPERAAAFLRWLASPDHGGPIFRRLGYRPPAPDR